MTNRLLYVLKGESVSADFHVADSAANVCLIHGWLNLHTKIKISDRAQEFSLVVITDCHVENACQMSPSTVVGLLETI
jgi:hypothetical protein